MLERPAHTFVKTPGAARLYLLECAQRREDSFPLAVETVAGCRGVERHLANQRCLCSERCAGVFGVEQAGGIYEKCLLPHPSATTPAACGAAMLVPDSRVVPPPSLVERIPTDFTEQLLVTFSVSSPGADTVTPTRVAGSNRPSVVNQEALSAAMMPVKNRHPPLLPSRAVELAIART